MSSTLGYWLTVWHGFRAQVAYRLKCDQQGCQQWNGYHPVKISDRRSDCWCATKWKPNRFWALLGRIGA